MGLEIMMERGCQLMSIWATPRWEMSGHRKMRFVRPDFDWLVLNKDMMFGLAKIDPGPTA